MLAPRHLQLEFIWNGQISLSKYSEYLPPTRFLTFCITFSFSWKQLSKTPTTNLSNIVSLSFSNKTNPPSYFHHSQFSPGPPFHFWFHVCDSDNGENRRRGKNNTFLNKQMDLCVTIVLHIIKPFLTLFKCMLNYVVEDKQAWKMKTNFYAKG